MRLRNDMEPLTGNACGKLEWIANGTVRQTCVKLATTVCFGKILMGQEAENAKISETSVLYVSFHR